MKNITLSNTTATDATRFRYLDHNFEASWTAPIHHNARIVEANGDLILQLQDLWDIDAISALTDVADLEPGCSFGEFLDEDVLQRWAEGWSFNLGDINAVDALWHLVFTFLVPTIEELPNGRLYRDIQQVRNGKRRPETLPSYTLRIHGAAVRYLLVETYDGPFTDDTSRNSAIMRRVAIRD
ncbi:hypothetical protein HDC37_001837 [Microbacterium sp. AK009]|uniref:hypothetical protein n=1 Tax=Microbacterium sp. AK009 TaxID=2723068 RepID=UPI0015CD396F|nr:hypothetical protein [Microbacterium sp. AK009]NYF17009.1 hypothetical protein [Microbacterium sp. AK009]